MKTPFCVIVLCQDGCFLSRLSIDMNSGSHAQVEYMPRASKSAILASAELPSGDLPSNCRPNFASAWRTKETFEV